MTKAIFARPGNIHDPSIRRLVFLAWVAALSACASTSLDNTWKDPQYGGGPVSKVLVVGISNQASARRAFEDTFAQALTQQGVQVVASYTLIPQDGQIAEEALQKAADQAGVNGVLITRLVGRKTDVYATGSVPPPAFGMRRGYYGYYTGAWVGYYEPATVQTTDYVIAETTLFRTGAPEPVWSATSRSLELGDVRKATEGFAKTMIAALKKEGLI
jgi:hypothetical protein